MKKSFLFYLVLFIAVIILPILAFLDIFNYPSKWGWINSPINPNNLTIIATLFVFCLGYLLIDSKVPDKDQNKLKTYTHIMYARCNDVYHSNIIFIGAIAYPEVKEKLKKETWEFWLSDYQDSLKVAINDFRECITSGYLPKEDYEFFLDLYIDIEKLFSKLKFLYVIDLKNTNHKKQCIDINEKIIKRYPEFKDTLQNKSK